jgi:hypothetical protein
MVVGSSQEIAKINRAVRLVIYSRNQTDEYFSELRKNVDKKSAGHFQPFVP